MTTTLDMVDTSLGMGMMVMGRWDMGRRVMEVVAAAMEEEEAVGVAVVVGVVGDGKRRLNTTPTAGQKNPRNKDGAGS